MKKLTFKRESFTLVEMLLSITIFTIVISVVLGMTSFAIKIQSKNLSDQYLLNQVDYTMEYLSRQLRMAQRNDGSDIDSCRSGCFYNFDGATLSFLDHNGVCQEISVDNGQINISGIPITSNKLEVTNFNIRLNNPCSSDTAQPRVTFSFSIKKRNSSDNPLYFQTTISPRELNL